jgi:hypothetical protein
MLGSYGYFYERKRGELETKYPTVNVKVKLLGKCYKQKWISNENASQAFLAFYVNQPGQAKREKSRIFLKDGCFYDAIFNKRDTFLPEKLMLSWKLLKYI